MGYYRVRKNWNNGKWDSSQICAYTDKEKAIAECTKERIEQGYKVFDPNGEVVYPIISDGDVIGSVILLSKDSGTKMSEVEQKVVQSAASFLGRQMEI